MSYSAVSFWNVCVNDAAVDIGLGVISDATKSAVVNVDYRLAPEHKWPAQLEDSLKLYKWVRIDRFGR